MSLMSQSSLSLPSTLWIIGDTLKVKSDSSNKKTVRPLVISDQVVKAKSTLSSIIYLTSSGNLYTFGGSIFHHDLDTRLFDEFNAKWAGEIEDSPRFWHAQVNDFSINNLGCVMQLKNGMFYAIGDNRNNNLGSSDCQVLLNWTECDILNNFEKKNSCTIKLWHVGYSATWFFDDQDRLFFMGFNTFRLTNQVLLNRIPIETIPNPKEFVKIIKIESGHEIFNGIYWESMYLLTNKGEVYVCGANTNYQLGGVNPRGYGQITHNWTRVNIRSGHRIVDLVAKNNESIWLTHTGGVLSGNQKTKLFPKEIVRENKHFDPWTIKIGCKSTQIAIGDNGAFLMDEENRLLVFGQMEKSNRYTKMISNTMNHLVNTSRRIKLIDGGARHAIFLMTSLNEEMGTELFCYVTKFKLHDVNFGFK